MLGEKVTLGTLSATVGRQPERINPLLFACAKTVSEGHLFQPRSLLVERKQTWILGLMAMAVGFATSARGGSDRSTTQIAESRDLIGHVDALVFQEFQRLWGGHRGNLLS